MRKFNVWKKTKPGPNTGKGGGRTSPNVNGPPFVKTIQREAIHGLIFRTTTRGAGPTDGEKMD